MIPTLDAIIDGLLNKIYTKDQAIQWIEYHVVEMASLSIQRAFDKYRETN